ncbi:hypothetical protein BSL82_03715 [Tardibacter chloracetimidivorans]|uniref:Uncharacterized protein n=1 Tax=Tardibacter chloracetimidivorans TaxID=1921510 RepID=A0A1L3ZSC3_9SPHN|nr:hypothetical protein [Tardibacter chloracetimidivorans]API58524.1 hypothetical protein BSL82_03715 [Tardibacter chloracetimidivorans]
MNFGELKDDLIALINRKDLTPARAGRFINRAVDRLERNVRLPFMERLVEYTITDSPDIDLPTDFLELANLYVDDVELEQVDMRRFLTWTKYGLTPKVFVKIRGQYKFRPEPAEGTVVSLHYYGAEDRMVTDADENMWAQAAEDAVLYGAAELAADFYEDERLSRFADKSAECAAELTAQGISDAFAGPMSVAPAAANEEY